ncbi:MAG: DUF3488 and transglutaminase-like domain-containing protein [Candidatus Hydrogenedentes bacterium]|nr:DUF3488 and transglutaminase-like domain-containing protein [Candidatus Hydrogenedentota bacterium]
MGLEDKEIRTLRIISDLLTVGIVVVSYLALSAVPEYGFAVLFVPIVPIFLSFFVHKLKETVPYYSKIVQIPLLCLGLSLPVTVPILGILHTVMLLTSAIQLTLLIYPKGIREYLYLVFMSFFLFLGAGAQAPEPSVGLSVVFFVSFVVILLPLVMMSELITRPGYVEYAKVNLVTPGNLLFARRYYIWAMFATIFVIVWSLVFVGFVYTPRVEAGLLGRDIGLRARTGIPQSVSLRGGQSIELSPTPVLSAYFPNAGERQPLPESKLYWRITTLPAYLGNQWRRWPLERSYEPSESENFLYILRQVQIRQGGENTTGIDFSLGRRMPYLRVAYEVYLDNLPEVGIPLLDKPQSVSVPRTGSQILVGWDNTKDATAVVATPGVRRLVYTAVSDVVDWVPEKLVEAKDNYNELLNTQDYKVLTQEDLSERAKRVIQEVVSGKERVYDKVKAIEDWLSGPEFRYTLNVPPLPIDKPIDAFLLEVKSGHCELFASAMALAVRSLGIPARVVSGYRGGEWDPNTRSYLVREGMAHLWVEVLFLDYGWVPFDPSPRGADFLLVENRYLQILTRLLLRGKIFWYRRVVGFDRGVQIPSLEFLNMGIFRDIDELINPGGNRMIPSTSLFVVGLVFLFSVIASLRILIFLWKFIKMFLNFSLRREHRRIARFSSDQLQARKLFLMFEKVSKKAGWDISNMTAEEIEKYITEINLELKDEIRDFLREYNEVRFGLKNWGIGKASYWRRKILNWFRPFSDYFNNVRT